MSSHDTHGTYVYGITLAAPTSTPSAPQRLTGVGDPPFPVRTVEEGGLAAWVSDCPQRLRPKRRDLLAHQRVLSQAAAAGPVLPLRFGSVSADDASVRAALAERAEHYRERLTALEGRVEYNVKAAHREEAVLRRVLQEEDPVRELNAANRAAGGGTYEDRLRLGELVAKAVQAREARDARLLHDALRPLAEDSRPGPQGQAWLANHSYLVAGDSADAFLAGVERFQRDNSHLEVKVAGPLPPYSFVDAGPGAQPSAAASAHAAPAQAQRAASAPAAAEG